MNDDWADVSIRDECVPIPPRGSFFQTLRELGVRSIEAAVDLDGTLSRLPESDGGPYTLFDPQSLARLRGSLKALGVRISALLLATDFSGGDADRQVEWTVRVIRAAEELGTPVVRIDPLTSDKALPIDSVCGRFIAGAGRVLDRTRDSAVDLGMENHAHYFNDPLVLDRVLEALPDPRFGLTLDTGNFYWWGHPRARVYELIERYAPRARHTHIKNIDYPPEIADQQREIGYAYKDFCAPLYAGSLDLCRIVEILRRSGYRRDLCIEDESLFKFPEPERIEVIRRDVHALGPRPARRPAREGRLVRRIARESRARLSRDVNFEL